MNGTYCLKINCKKNKKIDIGRLGSVEFKKGRYLYIGSAAKGIENRVLRHLRKRKKIFWHLDYLLSEEGTGVEKIYFIQSEQRLECIISKLVSSILKPVKGFGSSDCRCRGHLYLYPEDLLVPVEELLVKNRRFRSFSSRAFIREMNQQKRSSLKRTGGARDVLKVKGNNKKV